MNNCYKISTKDLNIPCIEMAQFLLGKLLVRKLEDGTILKGRIVETESYLGGDDKASLSYNMKVTPRNEPMYMPEGTCFVYMTYGMYYMLNISSIEPGAAVLLRALEPLVGIDSMKESRILKRKATSKKKLRNEELCNGPAKLCMSMEITKDIFNKLDICNNNFMWLEHDETPLEDMKIIACARIGIDSAGTDWAQKPLRFYIFNNCNVS